MCNAEKVDAKSIRRPQNLKESKEKQASGGTHDDSSLYLHRMFYKSNKNLLNDEICKERSRHVLLFMHEMWLQQTLCDAKINCSDGFLLTHQSVLSAYSPKLSSIFAQNAVHCTASIDLPDVSKRILANVLNFLYTTDLRLNCRNLEQIIHCAKLLNLPILLEVCDDYLIQVADPDNIILHYSVAYNSCLLDTKERLLSVISQSFDEIYTHPHFPLLTKEKLLEIIRHPLLNARDTDLFVAVMKWVEFMKDERLPIAHELLKNFDLKKIEIKAMSELLDEFNWMMIDPDCNKLVTSIYRHHALTKSKKRIRIDTRQEFGSILKDNREFNSILKENREFNSILKDNREFNSILKENRDFNSILKENRVVLPARDSSDCDVFVSPSSILRDVNPSDSTNISDRSPKIDLKSLASNKPASETKEPAKTISEGHTSRKLASAFDILKINDNLFSNNFKNQEVPNLGAHEDGGGIKALQCEDNNVQSYTKNEEDFSTFNQSFIPKTSTPLFYTNKCPASYAEDEKLKHFISVEKTNPRL